MFLLVTSYVIVALGFLLFGVLSALSWRRNRVGLRLTLASLSSALWGGICATDAVGLSVPFGLIIVVETLRNIAWLWFLSGAASRLLSSSLKKVVRAVSLISLIAALGWWLLPAYGATTLRPLRMLSVSGLVMSFLSLVVLEQIYRNAHMAAQSALRYLAVGLGSVFFYDLFMFAQVVLLQEVVANEWLVRGLVNIWALFCVVMAARRSTEWTFEIFVSRHAVFYTAAFSSVGLYLLLMSVAGYYIRASGGKWGSVVQLVFLAGAGIALLSVIFSVAWRRRVKVFIAKHFYKNKYDYRLEWLRFVNTLSDCEDRDVRQVALHAVAEVMGSPNAMLFSRDEDGNCYVATARWPDSVNLPADWRSVSIDEDWIHFMEDKRWIIDLQEYRLSPDLYQNIGLPDWIVEGARWRLLSPMFHADRLIGFVVLESPPPPFELTYEDRDLLLTLGRHVATHLVQHEVSTKLAEVRQFDAFNRLTAYMMHDLKNSVAQMSLLVRNAEKHKDNPEFVDDAISTIDNVAKRIETLVQQLKHGSSADLTQRILLERVVDRAVAGLVSVPPEPVVTFIDEDLWIEADFDRLVAVFGHLLRNAQEATPATGEIKVSIEHHGQDAWVVISDTGTGMDDKFIRERLFRPFETTKGTRGMGIGVYQARDYARSLGGDLVVSSAVGKGTQMKVRLPLSIQNV